MATSIRGHCDGIFNETLRGWIVNTAQPDPSEQILCWGEDGTKQASPPVSAAPAMPGAVAAGTIRLCHSALGSASARAVIRVTTMDGRELPNGRAVAVPPAAAPPVPGPVWVMLHVPKTAGTSMREALVTGFRPGHSLHIYEDGVTGITQREFAVLPLPPARGCAPGGRPYAIWHRPVSAQARTIRHRSARTARPAAVQFPPPVTHRTVFRRDGQPMPTTTAVVEAATEEFDNLMTRLISGSPWPTRPSAR